MKRIITSLILSIIAAFLWADSNSKVSLPWIESGYNVSLMEGTSSRTNYKIIKDGAGFLWVSTSNGVERYDGLVFRPYRLGKSHMRSIDDGFMVNIVNDKAGNIWTYSERNIVTKYNPELDAFEVSRRLTEMKDRGSISYLYSDGRQIVVGFTKGVSVLDIETDSLLGNYCQEQEIRCIERSDDTHILVGTRNGLWIIDQEQQTSSLLTAEGMDINCVKFDPVHGIIWMGSRGMGLFYVNKGDMQTCRPVMNDDHSIVNVIEPLNDSVMLVGTDGDGLKACLIDRERDGRYVPSEIVLVASESANAPCQLPNSVIDDILVDGDNLWLTLDLFGMALLHPRHDVPTMSNPVSLANADRNALDVSIDKDGRYWIAFPHCIVCYDKPTSEPKIYMKDVSGYLTIHAASDGTVWCGGYNAGTYHLDPATGKYEFFPSVVDQKVLDCVYGFAEDDNHDIWLGGLNFGLTRMHRTPSGKYEKTTYPEINLVSDIRTYNADTLIVGTFDGIWIVDTKAGKHEHVLCNQDNWTYTSSIASLVVAPNKEIWLGTMGAGLVRYDISTHEATLFAQEYSLPSLEIRGVELLNDSVICASTEKNGIFAFDIRNHRVIRAFSHSNGQAMGVFSRSSSGRRFGEYVAFGSDNGVISINDSDILSEHKMFNIFANGDGLIGNSIHLPFSNRNLDLQFTTNDIYHQNEYRFEYLIDGLMSAWGTLDESRSLHYLSLPPGSYDIKVRSYSATSLTSETTIHVKADQIFWLRWYCLLTYALLLLGLAWFFVNHYRIKHISETDGLTGIYNRYAGQKYTTEQLQMRVKGVFVLLDCDKFKHVNDTYGHLVGDKLLIRIALALKSAFPDDITMRLGGDEFAFFLVGHRSKDELREELQKLIDIIQSISISEIEGYKPSVSMGAAFYDGKFSVKFEQIYTQADKLLYESKKHEGCWMTIE